MEIIQGNKISCHFDGLVDFNIADFVNDRNRHQAQRILSTVRGGWYGPTCRTAEQSIEKAIVGDAELREEYLIPMIDQLNSNLNFEDSAQHVTEVKRRRTKSDFGDELDMQMVYQGKLDRAWTRTERIEIDSVHHLITVLIDIGENCNIKAVDSLWVAAACSKFCEEAERAGKSLQIIVGGAAQRCSLQGHLLTVSTCIKRYNEPLNMERLAAMSHLGFFRSFCFLGMLSSEKPLHYNLGRHASIQQNMPLQLINEINEGHTKVITLNQALSLRGALLSLKNAIAQMNS